MLGNVKKWIDKEMVAIDPELFPELLIELRIAILPTFCLFWKCFCFLLIYSSDIPMYTRSAE
jgi:hypothetical protein